MNKALFLDRDGTLIYDKVYLSDPGQVEVIPGASSALSRAQSMGYLLFLFTNQSGVGRNYFAMDDVHKVNKRMFELLDLPESTPAMRLAVRLDDLSSEGRIAWRVGRLRAADRLRAWLAHLALAALAPAGVPPRTRLVTRTHTLLFGAPDRPLEHLTMLAGLYVRGGSEPLPFFPETALAFVASLSKGEEAAWRAADRKWADERDNDAYLTLAFADAQPLDDRFAGYARGILLPMLAAETADA